MASSSAFVLSAPQLGSAVSTAPSTSTSFSVGYVDLLPLWLLEIAYTDGTACRTDLPLDGLGAERRDLHTNVAKLVACRAYDWLHIDVTNSLIRADAVHKIVSEAERRE